MNTYKIINADVIEGLGILADNSVQCVVTSPPYYGLRDYGIGGQLGLEPTPEEYLSKMVEVFRDVRRVLHPSGVCWVNMGDSYATSNPGSGGKCVLPGAGRAMTEARYTGFKRDVSGFKPKDLMMMPARLAIALQADGWWLRSEIVWHKPNPMPESVTDRPTKSHEMVYLLTKSSKYYYDAEAVKEKSLRENDIFNVSPHKAFNGPVPPTRNLRTVWTIQTHSFPEAHFATFPPKLVEPCIKAGSKTDDTILDPFSGSGTTGLVALELSRNYIGIELNPEYVAMSKRRLSAVNPMFTKEI